MAVIHGNAIDYLRSPTDKQPFFQRIPSLLLNGYKVVGDTSDLADNLWRYSHLAGYLGLLPNIKPFEIPTRVKTWLEENGWVLVFEDVEVEKLDALPVLFPSIIEGKDWVITSRDPFIKERLTEENFLLEGSNEFLTRLTGLDAEASTKIGEQLGYEPLALFLAGAYLRQTNISVSDYLKLISEELKQPTTLQAPEFCPAAVKAVFNITFRKLPFNENSKLKEVFYLSGYLPPDLPKALFQGASTAVEQLELLGLLTANQEAGAYSIHPFIQPLIRLKQEAEAAKATLEMIKNRLKKKLFLESQQEAIWRCVAIHFEKVGKFFQNRRFYEEANQCFQSSLELMKGIYGEEHRQLKQKDDFYSEEYRKGQRMLARSLTSLGLVHFAMDKMAEALGFLERAYRIRKAVCLTGELQISESLEHLGSVYSRMGNGAKAVQYYTRSLNAKSKIWNGAHPEVINLSRTLWEASVAVGQFDFASQVIEDLEGLGAVHFQEKQYDQAMEAFYTAWDILIKEVENGNQQAVSSKLLKVIESFQASLVKKENLNFITSEEASDRMLYNKVVTLFERSLPFLRKAGQEKSDFLAGLLHRLGNIYLVNRKYNDSVRILREALEIYEKLQDVEAFKEVKNDLGRIYKENLLFAPNGFPPSANN